MAFYDLISENDEVDNQLMVMRPYQIAATENILRRMKVAYNNKLL